MSPEIGTVAYAVAILGLFALDRDRRLRTSKALWIPVLWLLIGASRPVSAWLQLAPPASLETYVDGSPLDRFVFTSLLTAGVVVLISRGSRIGALLRTNKAILLFFAYCGMSVLWSDYPDVAFRRWVKFVGNLVMVLIVLTDSQPLAALKRLVARAGFLLLPVSVLLIKYYPGLGRTYAPGDFVSQSWRLYYTGVTDTKNDLGAVCLLFGLGALWRCIELLRDKAMPQRSRHLMAQGALLGVTVWLLGLANSMTSLACFLLAAGLILIASCPRLVSGRVAVHVLALGAVCVSLLATFVVPSLLVMIGRNPTLTGRTEIWKTVLGIAGNPMLGTGFESFWLGPRLRTIWSSYWWHPNEAHNGYIEIFLNLGWIGVALAAIVLIVGYRNVARAFHENPQEGKIRLAYFVVGVVYNLTESAFRMVDPVWFFFLVAALVIPEATDSENEPAVLSDQTDPFEQPEPELSYAHPEVRRGAFETVR